jgi:hypothetical protein
MAKKFTITNADGSKSVVEQQPGLVSSMCSVIFLVWVIGIIYLVLSR